MKSVLILLLCAVGSALSRGEPDSLRERIERITTPLQATVGVAISGPGFLDTLLVNGDHRAPMQSVYKFHLALAVLDRVDRGGLSLGQKVRITKADLLPRTWSPLREKYPGGNVELTLKEILAYTASQSDNNGCDILFRLLGGTAAVDSFIRGLGIEEVSIVATEEEMHRGWEVQYRNWTTPRAALQVLAAFHSGRAVSRPSRELLWDLMALSPTGVNRLRGLLPRGAVVAHKTGSSGEDGRGLTAATNDIGYLRLPDGGVVTIAVFVTDSKETEEVNERAIARIAKEAWDYYSSRGTRQTVPRIPGLVRP